MLRTLQNLSHLQELEAEPTARDKSDALTYITMVRKLIVFTPLFALLAMAIWFAVSAWVHLHASTIPFYGYLAIVGGVIFSLVVGGGLMALLFYSSRHGYDDLSGGDGGER